MIRQLIHFWSQHCALADYHRNWLHTVSQVIDVKRGAQLFEPDDDGPHTDYLYFVCDGLLATAWWDEKGSRRIDRFLLPDDSALTTYNLYTAKQVYYFVVALRRSTVIRIPTVTFKLFKESCREADVLSDVLEYKKLKQYRTKERLMLIRDSEERYIEFTRDDYFRKKLQTLISDQEASDYLNISRMTINRAIHRMLNNR